MSLLFLSLIKFKRDSFQFVTPLKQALKAKLNIYQRKNPLQTFVRPINLKLWMNPIECNKIDLNHDADRGEQTATATGAATTTTTGHNEVETGPLEGHKGRRR